MVVLNGAATRQQQTGLAATAKRRCKIPALVVIVLACLVALHVAIRDHAAGDILLISLGSVAVDLTKEPRHIQNNSMSLCKWTMIAGDSNNRNSFAKWLDLERAHQNKTGRMIVVANRSPMLYDSYDANIFGQKGPRQCEMRWADQEFILLTSSPTVPSTQGALSQSSCHIVSSRFMTDQFDVLRLVADWKNTSYCGSTLSDSLPPTFQRPVMPDSLWFSHGLWGVPNSGIAPPKDMTCEERFKPHVRAFQTWKSTILDIKWQTLFHISGHPKITNKFIDWDYQCQMKVAAQIGVSVYNLYDFVKPQLSSVLREGDYHLRDPTFLVEQFLNQCCGGWNSHFGSST